MTKKLSGKYDSRIPDFKSYEEEAAFWDTHDVSDFQDEFKTVQVKFAKNLTHSMNVRFDAKDITKLQEEADKKGIGPSTLARMWIKERLYGHQ